MCCIFVCRSSARVRQTVLTPTFVFSAETPKWLRTTTFAASPPTSPTRYRAGPLTVTSFVSTWGATAATRARRQSPAHTRTQSPPQCTRRMERPACSTMRAMPPPPHIRCPRCLSLVSPSAGRAMRVSWAARCSSRALCSCLSPMSTWSMDRHWQEVVSTWMLAARA